MTRFAAVLAAVLAAGTESLTSGELLLTQRQAYVMGTRVELSVFAPDRSAALQALDAALASLEASDQELSTWKPTSSISAINRLAIGHTWSLQPDLCRLLVELDEWRIGTGGTFDPGIGALTSAWGIHEDGRTPTPGELQTARARSGLRLFDIDRERCRVTRRGEATIDVGAFGKGEALDRARTVLNALPWMIDFGGQVSVGGAASGGKAWSVRLAHPLDRSRSIMSVQLKSGSLSTSAGSEHDVRVNGVRIGHILDPRTGVPAPYAGSVVVWHERALVADILSTALYVMGPREGMKWAESHDIATAFLIPIGDEVETISTASFAALEPTTEPE